LFFIIFALRIFAMANVKKTTNLIFANSFDPKSHLHMINDNIRIMHFSNGQLGSLISSYGYFLNLLILDKSINTIIK
ncbi:MAG: hypothetical protein K2G67_01980, partial [Muribaculaceae bacterium]|nr:hypothetical protein [Muribaculaceae bacterium]